MSFTTGTLSTVHSVPIHVVSFNNDGCGVSFLIHRYSGGTTLRSLDSRLFGGWKYVGELFPVRRLEGLPAPLCCCSLTLLHGALSTVPSRITGCRGFRIRCTVGTGTGPGILSMVHRDNLNTSYMDNNRMHTSLRTNFPTDGVMCTNIKGSS